MEHGTGRPYKDGPEVTLAGTHPVNKLARKQHAEGVDDGEVGGDGTIVFIAPSELFLDAAFAGEGERKHLTVHVIYCCCQEQHRANNPTIVGHFSRFDSVHLVIIRFD